MLLKKVKISDQRSFEDICKNQNEESENGMREIMRMWGIRVGMMGMWGIWVGMWGISVGMMEMRVKGVGMREIGTRNEGNQGENLRIGVKLMK